VLHRSARVDTVRHLTEVEFVYASRTNVPDYMIRGGLEYRLITNDLGSVRLVVGADDGTIAQRVDYDAFGVVTSDTAPGFQPFGFAGGLYDRDTKLVRFGARDYDAEAGRWTSRDPILFASGHTNLYVYAANDPVNLRDTRGLQSAPGDGGVCIGPPADLNLGKPLISDPKPQAPAPPLCPTCAIPYPQDKQAKPTDPGAKPKTPFRPNGDAPSSGGGTSGGDSSSTKPCVGPFCLSGGPNQPSISDVREKNPKSWFTSFDLKVDAPIYPDFTLPSTPTKPGGPDPNGPNPKPQGPQCKPSLDKPDPLGCEN